MNVSPSGASFLAVCVAALLSLAPLQASAKRERAPEPTPAEVNEAVDVVTDLDAYLSEREDIMSLVRMGDFGRIQRRDMRELNSAWSQLQGILLRTDSIAALSPNDKLKVYNAQQTFDAIIGKQRDSGLVCNRAAPTGSRINKTRCISVAEREVQREANKNAFQNLQGPTCIPGAGGAGGGGAGGGSC